MRSQKARPPVRIELMRVDDHSWVSGSPVNMRRLVLLKTPVREVRIRVGETIWWSRDIEGVETARAELQTEIERQAADLGIDFEALRAALQSKLLWKADEALVLAIAFAFPSPIQWDRARLRVKNKGRGRPPILDATWNELLRLARAWAAATGKEPGTGPNALFVAAVEAAAPHLPNLGPRGRASGSIRKLLERERNKLRGKSVRWLFPSPKRRLSRDNFTTSKPEK
jgi:hypothetical protein